MNMDFRILNADNLASGGVWPWYRVDQEIIHDDSTKIVSY